MRSGYSFGVTIQVRLAVAGCLPEEEARSSSPVHITCKISNSNKIKKIKTHISIHTTLKWNSQYLCLTKFTLDLVHSNRNGSGK